MTPGRRVESSLAGRRLRPGRSARRSAPFRIHRARLRPAGSSVEIRRMTSRTKPFLPEPSNSLILPSPRSPAVPPVVNRSERKTLQSACRTSRASHQNVLRPAESTGKGGQNALTARLRTHCNRNRGVLTTDVEMQCGNEIRSLRAVRFRHFDTHRRTPRPALWSSSDAIFASRRTFTAASVTGGVEDAEPMDIPHVFDFLPYQTA